ncbi:MAG: c-type cytochrome [Acidobacteriota bacterium]
MFRSLTYATACLVAVMALNPAASDTAYAQPSTARVPAASPAPQTPAAPAGPLAPEKFMNILALKDVPAAQLHDTMVYMEAALGANCTFCHVRNEAGEFAFEKDDRTNKKTARDMIAMTRNINAQNFKGEPEVTCATCHQGRHQPNAIPQLAETFTAAQIAAQTAARPPQAPNAPPSASASAPAAPGQAPAPPPQRARTPVETIDQITDKLILAMGGSEVLQKLTARAAKGTITNRMGQASPFAVEDTVAGQCRLAIEGAQPTVRAFDGHIAWLQSGDRIRELEGVEAAVIGLSADLGFAMHLKERYQGLAARAYDKIDGRDVIVMSGRPAPAVTELLSVDKMSGLLVRRVVRFTTALGRLSAQIDYADYRSVAGVTLPYAVKVSTWDAVWDQTFSAITLNPVINPAQFAKPAAKTSK